MNLLKTLRKSYFAIYLASLILFVSCSQYDNTSNLESYSKKNRILTDNQILEIGIGHNTNLTELFSNNPQNLNDVTEKTLKIYSEKGLNNKILNDYFSNVDKMNTNFLVDLIDNNKNNFVNSKLLTKKIIEIKGLNSIDLLKEHEKITREQLEGIDLDLYLVLSTVYQYSTEFWNEYIPKHKGLSERLLTKNNLALRTQPGWVEADGISAAIGFVTIAFAFAAISAVGIATGGAGIIPTVGIVAGLLEISAQSTLASIYAAIKK